MEMGLARGFLLVALQMKLHVLVVSVRVLRMEATFVI